MKKRKEIVVYIGRRTATSGRVVQAFQQKNGKEICFKGLRHLYIGHSYEMINGTIAVQAEWLRDIPRINNAKWEAADALIDAENAKKRAQAKVAALSKPKLKEAKSILSELTQGMGFFDRLKLIDYLVKEISK